MWGLNENARVYLCLGVTDMRRSINGLSAIVEHELSGQLSDGDLFVFCNRAKTIVKLLYWDRNGYCLWQKRLEKFRFKWPLASEEQVEVDRQALTWLLQGLDIRQAHERLSKPMAI